MYTVRSHLHAIFIWQATGSTCACGPYRCWQAGGPNYYSFLLRRLSRVSCIYVCLIFVCVCFFFACSTRSRLVVSSSIIPALTRERRSRHWLHAILVFKRKHLISHPYLERKVAFIVTLCILIAMINMSAFDLWYGWFSYFANWKCRWLVFVVFDWDFSGPSNGQEGGDPANIGQSSRTNNKLVDGIPRLRDAAAPSSPVILPGPALLPSMGSQPLRLNGRARKSRITEPGLQLIPNAPSG